MWASENLPTSLSRSERSLFPREWELRKPMANLRKQKHPRDRHLKIWVISRWRDGGRKYLKGFHGKVPLWAETREEASRYNWDTATEMERWLHEHHAVQAEVVALSRPLW